MALMAERLEKMFRLGGAERHDNLLTALKDPNWDYPQDNGLIHISELVFIGPNIIKNLISGNNITKTLYNKKTKILDCDN